mmetsp:Transcript_23322/g.57790  ORF Transcript_23322/g.57790 Transcript_23322/m.57790 type:complete len:238 (-) Transcript_23322:1363-2076(-)
MGGRRSQEKCELSRRRTRTPRRDARVSAATSGVCSPQNPMHMRNSERAESTRPMTARRMESSPWLPGRLMTELKRTPRSCHCRSPLVSNGCGCDSRAPSSDASGDIIRSMLSLPPPPPEDTTKASAAAAAAAASADVVSPSSAGSSISPVCSSHTCRNRSSSSVAASPSTRQSQSLFPVALVGSMLEPPMTVRRPSAPNIFMCDLMAYPPRASVALKKATRKFPSGHPPTAAGIVCW